MRISAQSGIGICAYRMACRLSRLALIEPPQMKEPNAMTGFAYDPYFTENRVRIAAAEHRAQLLANLDPLAKPQPLRIFRRRTTSSR